MNLQNYIGKTIKLLAIKDSKHGIFLAQNTHSTQSVLLPNIYCNNIHIGDEINVFLYTDSEDRIIATTQMPTAFLDEIALLPIKDKTHNGLYLDIGLAKDIFMPSKNPNQYKDSHIVVRISKDKQHRLIAKKDISPLLKLCKTHLTSQNMQALAYKQTPLGISCIIFPYYYEGLIQHDNIKGARNINRFYDVRISRVRKDGKLDLVINHNNDNLLREIQYCNNKGIAFTINDTICSKLNISKKSIKKQLSNLITKKQIYYLKDKGYFITDSMN